MLHIYHSAYYYVIIIIKLIIILFCILSFIYILIWTYEKCKLRDNNKWSKNKLPQQCFLKNDYLFQKYFGADSFFSWWIPFVLFSAPMCWTCLCVFTLHLADGVNLWEPRRSHHATCSCVFWVDSWNSCVFTSMWAWGFLCVCLFVWTGKLCLFCEICEWSDLFLSFALSIVVLLKNVVVVFWCLISL